eukprot:2770242-Rhodomonas_salina.1
MRRLALTIGYAASRPDAAAPPAPPTAAPALPSSTVCTPAGQGRREGGGGRRPHVTAGCFPDLDTRRPALLTAHETQRLTKP